MNSSDENKPPVDSHARIGQAIKRLAKQPSFIVAFSVLLLAAVSLNATTQFLQLHFKKLPVPLAHSLEAFPATVGNWVSVMKDQLADDVQQELATDKYIMRYYVDTSVVSKEDLAAFEGKDNPGRMAELSRLRTKYHNDNKINGAIISFAVTYYTGKADTVAHIPERCYTADGYEPTDIQTEMWDLKSDPWRQRNPGVRYVSFEDQTETARVRKNVAYFFHVNGEYQSDPKRVRMALQNLFQKHGYYAKVEVMVQGDREASAISMKDFLTQALPQVEKCLPDWSQYDGKGAAGKQ
jgi:hypothetical protein